MARKHVLWQSVMVRRCENGFTLDWDVDEVVRGRRELCDGGFRVVSGDGAVDDLLVWLRVFLENEL